MLQLGTSLKLSYPDIPRASVWELGDYIRHIMAKYCSNKPRTLRCALEPGDKLALDILTTSLNGILRRPISLLRRR